MSEFILGLIGKLIFSEIIDWSPKLEEIILRVYANKLPAEIASRALEEAQALLDGTPGKLIRLARALDLLRASRRITHEYYYPELSFHPHQLALMTVVDRLLAALILVFLAPLLGLISVGIKFASRGSIFARSPYSINGGRVGVFLTFRTTLHDQAKLDVERIRAPRFMHLLRITGLQFLPMLWNVLCGEASMVGCRSVAILTPGDNTLPFVSPKRPELLRAGILVELTPEEEQKFIQNPLRSYFLIMGKTFRSSFSKIPPCGPLL